MRISGLPIEVVDILLWHLDLDAVRCLRLTNRELAAKASASTTFKGYFRTKTIDVTDREQLQTWERMTTSGQLGCLLEHLFLASSDVRSPDPTCARYLSQSLRNLGQFSKHMSLKKLTLQAARSGSDQSVATEDWQRTWAAAGHVFSVAVDALCSSGTAVESLDIFGNSERCSLACNSVTEKLPILYSSEPFRLLSSLALSVSHHVTEDLGAPLLQPDSSGMQNAQAVSSLVNMAPALTEFQLHWYNLRTSELSEALVEERRLFNNIAHSCRFDALVQCALSGIFTEEASLLVFVQKCLKLTNVKLEEVHLETGRFRPVFEHLRPRLESLQLRDLYEGEKMICFDAPGKPPFPTSRRSGPTSLTRHGSAARDHVHYNLQQGRPMGSALFLIWTQEKQAKFGPP